MEFDLVDCWYHRCVFQEPLEIVHAPVRDPNGPDLVGVLPVDLLDFLVDVQLVDFPVGLFILQV